MNAPNPEVRFFANDVREMVAELNSLTEKIVGIESASTAEFRLEDFRDALVMARRVRLMLESALPTVGGAS